DHAVFGTPSFPTYRISAQAASLQSTAVELDDKIHWNGDKMIQAIAPNTRIVFIDSPNNPTGSYLPAAQLRRLLEHASAQTLIVIDEAYFEYADAHDYQSALEFRQQHQNLLVLRTFSKAFGLAALRIGYGIADPETIAGIEKVRPPFNVNALAQLAACIALQDLSFVLDNARRTCEERTRMSQALSKLDLYVAPSQANFLLVKMPRAGRSVSEELLKRGIIVRPMSEPIADYLRISIGKPDENSQLLQVLPQILS